MIETVIVVRGFANDGSPEPAACISTYPKMIREGVYQHLTSDQLETFEDNLTGIWTATFNGETYDLIGPMPDEVDFVRADEEVECPF